MADARQLAQLENRQEGAEQEVAEDADKRIRLGRLEGENVLLRSVLRFCLVLAQKVFVEPNTLDSDPDFLPNLDPDRKISKK